MDIERPRPPLADCTPPPLPQQLFVCEGLEGGGGLEGGEGAVPPFTHKPTYTVQWRMVHAALGNAGIYPAGDGTEPRNTDYC